ncbi:pentatricopeptide repeat-containing protein At5g66500, mitochondrial [Prosopis cineraria]|uniref:pentatricopeptide repeat-containing protein At5g66500, mitochondrial n=1 Tax=Prosopis cineraria TaxID=364024 RepID=UPI00240F431A|nr:pentatricopeptide repeat-containing protein At5g66500, mitochondrial [Prosopis cineraria]
MFDEMLQRCLPAVNSFITWHVRQRDAATAWAIFYRMRYVRSDIDVYTFTPVLGACSMLPNPERGKQVHTLMIKTGSDSGTVIETALMDMYSKYGLMDESLKVFEEMEYRDVMTWNVMLSNLLRHDLPREALGVLIAMRGKNVEFNEFTLCAVLKTCASLKALKLGKQVHGLVVSMGRDLVVLSTALVDFYSSVGQIDEALKVFNTLNCTKDDMMHNSLISGCLRNQRYEEAFSVMRMMKPNVVALTSALAACSENSDLRIAKQIHCVAIRQDFTSDTQLCNVLLDMYAKCGEILHARLLFDRISRKDVISWTSMIDAYGNHGHGHAAVMLFEEMSENGTMVLPNLVTFLAVLSACGHSMLVEEGRKCFQLGREKYGLEPGPEHYACFIDILGRAGRVDEAWSIYYHMMELGTKPTAGAWIALLNACSLNMDAKRGEFAVKHLLELEPSKASNIVLVSNYYAAIGRWDCVDELRNIMSTKGLFKEAGNSWITVAGSSQGLKSLSS